LDRQINHFFGRFIGREQLSLLNSLAYDAVERLYGIGGVDRLADILRVAEQGIEVVPMGLPGTTDLWIFFIPACSKLFQGQQGFFLCRRLVDQLKV
jgi:hypothetical protein